MKFVSTSVVSASLVAFTASVFLVSGEPWLSEPRAEDRVISVRSLPEPTESPAILKNPAAAVQQAKNATEAEVVPDHPRAFEISRHGTPTIQVTFLTPTAFRLHVPGHDAAAGKIPDYMRVKTDSDYPPPEVRVDEREDDVTFTTSAGEVRVVPNDGEVSVSVTTPDKSLSKTIQIHPGKRIASVELMGDERVYGFGDKRAALDQRGNKVQMLNRDAFASENNESYKSIPFYMSSAGYGLFFHNFYPSVFDVGSSSRNTLQLSGTGGDMDFYVFLGEPKSLLSQYTDLTGRPAMLPRWAFGYHQAKASYEGRDAFKVAREMRRRKLPVDVIYYDDWEDEAVEKGFINSLWQQYQVRLTHGFGMPMFGTYRGSDDSDLVHELAAGNFLMVGKNGKPIIAPDQHVDASEEHSAVAYVDYFSPGAVEHLFDSKWDEAIDNGAILGMVDFGELDHIPHTDAKFWPSLGMSVAQTRNLFGLVYPLSIVSGVLERQGGRSTGMVRPGFAGTQRLGWATTGDSLPTYRNFRAHMRGMLNLTLSGFSNVGQDIGGWDSKGPDILYARWFAAGTFYPFMWSHGQGDHEPYAHGEAVEKVAREFLNLRYRMVPYLYSLHEEANRTGVPLLRSFPLEEASDPLSHRIDDQFFVGDNMMVAPLFNDHGDRKLYLPKGLWYDFFGEQPAQEGGREIERTAVPLNRLPVYVRAGAVIPLGPLMQRTGEKPVDPLTVHVYSFGPAEEGEGPRTSTFALYEDDGQSNDYRNGKFQRTDLRFEQSAKGAKLEIKSESGDGQYWAVPARSYRFHLHGFANPVTAIRIDGKEIAHGVTDATRRVANWTTDAATGDVVIAIPRTSKRSISVEFSAERAWAERRDVMPKVQ